jgi:protein involved in polysaccharide export with SLBB domain
MLLQIADAHPSASDPTERVIVAGEIGRPREVSFTPQLTLVKAILAVGGYGDFSSKSVSLIRHGKVRRVDLRAIIEGQSRDISLEPWDIIIVGKTLSPGERR